MKAMAIAFALGLGAIGRASAAEPTPDPAAEARSLAGQFQKALSKELRAAMANGPETAVAVCRDVAPALAARLSRESGWQVRRISLRVRDPLIGLPDAWEQAQLGEFERRVEAGADPATLETFTTVAEPAGRSERYVRAIVLAPLCEGCHGDPRLQSAALRKVLVETYPHDAAVGYKAGQLRGAISLKRSVP